LRISRKALLQSGDALEAAIRRDMSGTMAAELDKAIFLGTGATGQPLGVMTTPATYGITSTDAGGHHRGRVRSLRGASARAISDREADPRRQAVLLRAMPKQLLLYACREGAGTGADGSSLSCLR